MHFVLADDQREHHAILRRRLEASCAELGIRAEFGLEAEKAEEVLAYAEHAPEETVWFLDIELGEGINGVELCRRVRELNRNAYIIYVSAYQQYALECCQSHAFDFLLKPWTDEQLTECLKAVDRDMKRRRSGTELTVEMGTRLLRLVQEEIIYFSKDRMSVVAHCGNGQTYTWRGTFEELTGRLVPGLFFTCHKSYLINLRAVREARWAENMLAMANGDTVPLSRRREAELKRLIGS